jgi:hypothetical protein
VSLRRKASLEAEEALYSVEEEEELLAATLSLDPV